MIRRSRPTSRLIPGRSRSRNVMTNCERSVRARASWLQRAVTALLRVGSVGVRAIAKIRTRVRAITKIRTPAFGQTKIRTRAPDPLHIPPQMIANTPLYKGEVTSDGARDGLGTSFDVHGNVVYSGECTRSREREEKKIVIKGPLHKCNGLFTQMRDR
jgi:hypothetical protein